jgi:MYXO-CTERM domain-containing protein
MTSALGASCGKQDRATGRLMPLGDLGEYPDAGPVLPGDGGVGGNGGGFTGRTGVACACNGGPGSGGTGVLLAFVGLVVLRKRRRA